MSDCRGQGQSETSFVQAKGPQRVLKGQRTACRRENWHRNVPLLSARVAGDRNTNKGVMTGKCFIDSGLSADREVLWLRVPGGLAGGAIAGGGGNFCVHKKVTLGKWAIKKWAKTGGAGVG